jgi:hypothetical protein
VVLAIGDEDAAAAHGDAGEAGKGRCAAHAVGTAHAAASQCRDGSRGDGNRSNAGVSGISDVRDGGIAIHRNANRDPKRRRAAHAVVGAGRSAIRAAAAGEPRNGASGGNDDTDEVVEAV